MANLSPENRKKLDGIVAQLASKNAPKEHVQAIVQDFVSKYSDAPTVTTEEEAALEQKELQGPAPTTIYDDVPKALSGLWDHTRQRAGNIEAPTVLGGNKPGSARDIVAGTPERAVRAGLGAVGTLGDILGTAGGTIVGGSVKGYDAMTGGRLGKSLSGIGKAVASSAPAQFVGEKLKKYEEFKNTLTPAERANWEAAESGLEGLVDFIPIKVPKVVRNIGKKIEKGGKSLLASGAKIKDTIAAKSGRTVAEGVDNLMTNISKHELESPVGGFSGIKEKALKKVTTLKGETDDLLLGYTKSNPDVVVDVDDAFVKFADDLATGKEKTIFTTEEAAEEFAYKIHESLEKRGLAGEQPVAKLPEIKKAIDDGLDLFKKGPYNVDLDPLPKKVGELAYTRIKETLNSKIPGLAEKNKAIHELLNIDEAMDATIKRIGNNNKLGLRDAILLSSGSGGGAAAMIATGHPVAGGLISLPGAIALTSKLGEKGRGASAIIKAGKAVQGMGRTDMPTLKKALGIAKKPVNNQRGSVQLPGRTPRDYQDIAADLRAKNPSMDPDVLMKKVHNMWVDQYPIKNRIAQAESELKDVLAAIDYDKYTAEGLVYGSKQFEVSRAQSVLKQLSKKKVQLEKTYKVKLPYVTKVEEAFFDKLLKGNPTEKSETVKKVLMGKITVKEAEKNLKNLGDIGKGK